MTQEYSDLSTADLCIRLLKISNTEYGLLLKEYIKRTIEKNRDDLESANTERMIAIFQGKNIQLRELNTLLSSPAYRLEHQE